MDFSLGLHVGPRNKKVARHQPPMPSGHGPPAASPGLPCPSSVCACPCPACPPPSCSCPAGPYSVAPCPSCPSLPGPPCVCFYPPCPACPPLVGPHTSCSPCAGPPVTCCHLPPHPIYPHSKGQAAYPISCWGRQDGCSCGPGATWGPPGATEGHSSYCCCRRGQRISPGRCQIV
ncbi:uncharacterized protein LOC142451492 [Tenrec ecaudatus]|uniref:uncharacterized protein LOC142451492 n=1 Tax=Tenrec ecaudatus TaxID=94439 RepID=UPI003F59BF40